jgi:DNA-directed RNA polymerase specialized sigma24 family protein|tara:strand:+ start:607 stop:1080 length:474 start_codon:yes stop_codon:yes gene_type:complete
MEKDIENLYKKHKTWIKIVKSFGCNNAIAEDLVQEMYYKIILKMKDGLDIKYNENEINYYYIFRTLNSLYIDLTRKRKNIHIEGLENIKNKSDDPDFMGKYELVEKELNKMYWYDKKVFEIINGGESIASLSRKSHIPYYSLYNTYTKVKIKLKKLL